MPIKPGSSQVRLALSWIAIWIGVASFARAQQQGEAISLTEKEIAALTAWSPVAPIESSSFTDGQISGFTVDTQDRTEVLAFYHCIYQASEDFAFWMDWVGDVGNCVEGTVSNDFHDDTLRRINYYRAMVGLNTDITLDSVKNQKCQEAALIMSRNNGLSHDPIGEHPDWFCLTADGDEAAGKSNISWGSGTFYTGPAAVDGQIRDNGANNVPVGHRRWLLYSRALEMGNGGISGEEPGYGSSAAVWVIGGFAPPPGSPPWTSWPNQGYVPHDLVPARWSFSMPGADFDNATVTMTHGGSPVTAVIIHPTLASPAAGYGDATIVWEPAGIPTGAPATDLTYDVTVSGIVGGSQASVAYSVTVMDPYDLQHDMVISGPVRPMAFVPSTYAFNPLALADSYQLRIQKIAAATWTEGAEDNPPPSIIDDTDPSYLLRQTSLVRTGAKAFHMAFPDWNDQQFEIDRTIVPSSSSDLTFAFRRRFSHTANRLAAEISTDQGDSWSEVWSVSGVCGSSCGSGDWDNDWIPVSSSLAAYAGLPTRVRFVFEHNYQAYLGTGSNDGVFLDDIQVTESGEQVDLTETTLPGTAVDFTLEPDGLYSYIMDMNVEAGCNHQFDWGPAFTSTSVPLLRAGQATTQGSQLTIGFTVTGGDYTGYDLFNAADLDGPWNPDPAAVLNLPQKEFTTIATNEMFYRVGGETP